MKLLFIGDSITDSTRANREDPHSTGRGYVFLLESELTAQGEAYEVLNCGISGNRVVDLLARIKKDCMGCSAGIRHRRRVLRIYHNRRKIPRIYHRTVGSPECF